MFKMKRLIITSFLLSLALNSLGQAENYRLVRFDFGFSYIMPSSNRFANGFGFSPELKFQLTDRHTLGGKIEIYAMVGDDGYVIQGSQLSSRAELKTGAIVGISLLNEFYLTDTKVRPFIGTGFGFYAGGSASESVDINVAGGSLSAEANGFAGLGLSPTVGFHWGFLKLSASYNYIFNSTDVTVKERIENGNFTEEISLIQEESNNFITLKLMMGIGGGRKN